MERVVEINTMVIGNMPSLNEGMMKWDMKSESDIKNMVRDIESVKKKDI